MRAKRQRQQTKPVSGHVTEQFWPRRAATAIIEMETRDQMLEAIERVPEQFREWVRFYLNDWIRKAGSLSELKIQIQYEKSKREGRN